MINYTILSRYRTQVLGVATILVLVVHTLQFVQAGGIIGKLVVFLGGLGVPMFAFLSGIGIYNSLQKCDAINSDDGIKIFYNHRIHRTLLPYLIISTFGNAIYCFLYDGSLSLFAYKFSLLSFWLEHDGPWYFAMLIPLYIIAPYYAKWIEYAGGGGA